MFNNLLNSHLEFYHNLSVHITAFIPIPDNNTLFGNVYFEINFLGHLIEDVNFSLKLIRLKHWLQTE